MNIYGEHIQRLLMAYNISIGIHDTESITGLEKKIENDLNLFESEGKIESKEKAQFEKDYLELKNLSKKWAETYPNAGKSLGCGCKA